MESELIKLSNHFVFVCFFVSHKFLRFSVLGASASASTKAMSTVGKSFLVSKNGVGDVPGVEFGFVLLWVGARVCV